MKLAEERQVAAEPFVDWAAVLCLEAATQSAPGYERLTGNAADCFSAVVGHKIGPVKARFNTKVILSDIGEGRSPRISGGGHGCAKGTATVSTAAAQSGWTTGIYTMTPMSVANLRSWTAGSSTGLQLI